MRNKAQVKFSQFIKSCGEEEPDYESSWFAGWEAAEKFYKKRIKELEEIEWKYKELCK